MAPEFILFAMLIGYLAGSFSAARFIVRVFAPDHVLNGIRAEVPEGNAVFQSNVISATTVRLQLGSRYGCLTSILDMLKASLPALVFRAWQPDQAYYLIAAGSATAGHIWPIYYHFKGGRGMSPILGGMFVVDWLGVIITQAVGVGALESIAAGRELIAASNTHVEYEPNPSPAWDDAFAKLHQMMEDS